MANPKRAVALILSLFVLIVLGGFISLATYQYVADRMIHQHYENSIKSLYAIETARSILLWEESHAPTINSWDTDTTSSTYNSDIRFPGTGATITNKFYCFSDSNSGFDIKARVKVISGNVYMYIMAYKGDEDAPQEAQYLEYVHSPSPMYKYAIFSNTSLVFSGSKLYDLKGGSIHSNGNLEFKPTGYGIRFNNMAQMTASGAIKYGLRYQYPAPHIVDNMDGSTNGMAPAPSLTSDHYQTTTDTNVIPGPFRYWSTDSATGITNLSDQWYASYVANNWGSYGGGSYPLIFRGDETYFYGRQTSYGSYFVSDERTYSYLRSDGTYGSYSSSNKTDVSRYYLSGESLYNSTNSYGYYQSADVYFKPATTSSGSANTTWFELPGSLPQEYSWTDKYAYSSYTENPVTFYITESCTAGSASCKASAASGTATTGWRYAKEDKDGNACATDDCYNDAGGAYGSGYVKAQDYETGETSTAICTSKCSYSDACNGEAVYACDEACANAYYECWESCDIYYNDFLTCYYACSTSDCRNACYEGEAYTKLIDCDNGCYEAYSTCSQPCWAACNACYDSCYASPDKVKYYDKMSSYYYSGTYHPDWGSAYSWTSGFDANSEFISDYAYGGDVVSGKSTSQTTAFNSSKQPEGFSQYLNLLSQKNISGVLDSGVAKKDPYLGNLFDTASTGDSAYKDKAKSAGIYLDGTQSPSDIVSTLNSDLDEDAKYASVDTFYNWKTADSVVVVNIDVGKMKAAMAAGKVSFSNGVMYSEVPVMLSNAEDLPGASSSDKTAVFTLVSEDSVYLKGNYNTENWKISNIATDKRIYTLSDAFSANTLPDPTVYINYPYVKVSVTKDRDGKIVSYDAVSANQEGAAGAHEVWINAEYTSYTASGIYSYYQGMSDTLRSAVRSTRDTLQSSYVSDHTEPDGTTNFPNTVDNSAYNYNSLFITPYDIEVLENWKYQTGTDSLGKATYGTALRNLTGAFINFSNCSTTDFSCKDNYKDVLDSEEYCTSSTCSGGFDYRDRKAPKGYLYYVGITSPSTVQSYDGNFPTASPASSEGVLGFTGQNSWRPISKDYFDSNTEG